MQNVKRKKILNIIVNVIVAIILIFVFILSILILSSGKKGYVDVFGTATVAVESSSMDGDKPDSFKKGDLVSIKILYSNEAKQALEVGQIITFRDRVEGKDILNTHRIVAVKKSADDIVWGYVTKGDNPLIEPDNPSTPDVVEGADTIVRDLAHIVGVYTGKTPGLGNVVMFFKSSTGFMVCVLIPAVLVACYCIYLVVRSALKMKSKKSDVDEKERLRREILIEMGIDPDSETGKAMAAASAAKQASQSADGLQKAEESATSSTAADSATKEDPTATPTESESDET